MSKKSNKYDTSSLEEVIRKTCEYNINDWQHWHLGNTLTWTPFRDLEMFKLFARLSVDDLKKQMMCSAVQIELIRRSSPELLSGLANQKNSENCLENLTNILVDN
jgi:hypothetical protein